ncbi:hypothetical protein D5S19_21215 [Amycolatopsis panacis]|uniref:Uncharacterized protein n=1 Tax=Amycolatopsis panacis TaxID=2340917 RepID=A0A419HZN1_9PSEU|nr:hypothetical protein D5S19_21215 [Amycolatopsis panacis]
MSMCLKRVDGGVDQRLGRVGLGKVESGVVDAGVGVAQGPGHVRRDALRPLRVRAPGLLAVVMQDQAGA